MTKTAAGSIAGEHIGEAEEIAERRRSAVGDIETSRLSAKVERAIPPPTDPQRLGGPAWMDRTGGCLTPRDGLRGAITAAA